MVEAALQATQKQLTLLFCKSVAELSSCKTYCQADLGCITPPHVFPKSVVSRQCSLGLFMQAGRGVTGSPQSVCCYTALQMPYARQPLSTLSPPGSPTCMLSCSMQPPFQSAEGLSFAGGHAHSQCCCSKPAEMLQANCYCPMLACSLRVHTQQLQKQSSRTIASAQICPSCGHWVHRI